jgi:hypothetical protein
LPLRGHRCSPGTHPCPRAIRICLYPQHLGRALEAFQTGHGLVLSWVYPACLLRRTYSQEFPRRDYSITVHIILDCQFISPLKVGAFLLMGVGQISAVLRNLADLTSNNRHLDRRTSVCNKLPANSRPKAIFLRLCNTAQISPNVRIIPTGPHCTSSSTSTR